jgi:arsenate reductase-like glutaredoxin family protein
VRAWLSQADVELRSRDFFEDRFSEAELRELFGDRPVSDFFSWNSPSFRKMGRSRDSVTDDDLVALMLDEPRLVRRPLVVVDGEVVGPLSGTDRITAAVTERLG